MDFSRMTIDQIDLELSKTKKCFKHNEKVKSFISPELYNKIKNNYLKKIKALRAELTKIQFEHLSNIYDF